MPADAFVRRARPTDAPQIAAVQARAWHRAYADLLTPEVAGRLTAEGLTGAWTAELDADDRTVFVAVEGPDVVGAATVRTEVAEAELATLVVDPDRQRRGHGSRLLSAVTDTLRAEGTTAVRTWSPAVDDARLRFLTSAGLQPDGARRVLRNADGDEVVEIRFSAGLGPGAEPSS